MGTQCHHWWIPTTAKIPYVTNKLAIDILVLT